MQWQHRQHPQGKSIPDRGMLGLSSNEVAMKSSLSIMYNINYICCVAGAVRQWVNEAAGYIARAVREGRTLVFAYPIE